jgi:hypothetical protein
MNAGERRILKDRRSATKKTIYEGSTTYAIRSKERSKNGSRRRRRRIEMTNFIVEDALPLRSAKLNKIGAIA